MHITCKSINFPSITTPDPFYQSSVEIKIVILKYLTKRTRVMSVPHSLTLSFYGSVNGNSWLLTSG